MEGGYNSICPYATNYPVKIAYDSLMKILKVDSVTSNYYYVPGRWGTSNIYGIDLVDTDIKEESAAWIYYDGTWEKGQPLVTGYPVRPSVKLKSTVKITSGDGKSKSTAYGLG